jgi:hypothetical protein
MGYTGLTGTVDLVQLYQHRPHLAQIGPMNPIDVFAGCAGSGALKLALDLTPVGIVPDVVDAAMQSSFNPLFNSGNKLGDLGNEVEAAKTGAEVLSETLPFLKPVAKKLGPVGVTISVAKFGTDLYNCVQ